MKSSVDQIYMVKKTFKKTWV